MSETSRPSTITVGRVKKSHIDKHQQDKLFFRCVGSGEAANAAGAPAPGSRSPIPDSEVIARPHRRRFNAEYKLSIIDQADSARDAGAIGLLLSREGLYSSHLSNWRTQRKQGEFDALTARKRGPKVVVSPLVKQNREQEAVIARLNTEGWPPGFVRPPDKPQRSSLSYSVGAYQLKHPRCGAFGKACCYWGIMANA